MNEQNNLSQGDKILRIISLFVMLIAAVTLFQNQRAADRESSFISGGAFQEYTLETWEESRGGYWINVRNTKTNDATIVAFVAFSCPQFEDRVYKGKKMLLAERRHMRLATQEEFTEMYRSFYYLCTDKNMEQKDRELLDVLGIIKEMDSAPHSVK